MVDHEQLLTNHAHFIFFLTYLLAFVPYTSSYLLWYDASVVVASPKVLIFYDITKSIWSHCIFRK